MVAQQPEPQPRWLEDSIQSSREVLIAIGGEGLERSIIRPTDATQKRIDDYLSARLGFKAANALSEYNLNLSIEIADFALLLGYALALTRADAFDGLVTFQDWLAAALRRAGLDNYIISTTKPDLSA